MKKIFLLYLLFYYSIPSFSQNPIKKTLTWAFFRNDRPVGETMDALTWYKISYSGSIIGSNSVTVKMNFKTSLDLDTSKSFFNSNKRFRDTKLLKHEQGHADIGFIYACKLRDSLNRTVFVKNKIPVTIDKVFKSIYEEMNRKNREYDIETDHGKNEKVQERWNLYFIELFKRATEVKRLP